jgi:hypothetical protein
MNRSPQWLFPFSLLVVLVFVGFPSPLRADPSRVDCLQSIQAEYAKAREDFGNAIRAGTIKPNDDGEYPGLAEVTKRFAKPVRELIDADPADAVALDALLFSLNELGRAISIPAYTKLP